MITANEKIWVNCYDEFQLHLQQIISDNERKRARGLMQSIKDSFTMRIIEKELEDRGDSISTDYLNDLSYSACVEGYEEDGPYGRGATEAEAILDLKQELWEIGYDERGIK